MSTVSFGRGAETAAAEYLASRGAEILCRNYAVRGAEIDIIAREGMCIIFAEVKASANESAAHGAPRERVTQAKQRRICRAALRYLQENGLGEAPVRFDVLEVTPSGVTHLKAAFEYAE